MQNISPVEHIGVPAISHLKTVFLAPLIVIVVNGGMYAFLHRLAVIGMNMCKPGFTVHCSFIMPECIAECIAPPYFIGSKVPVPQRIIGCPRYQPEPFFAERQL